MGRFMPVEHTLLYHDHAVPVGAPVHHAGPYTAAGALAAGDDRVHSQVVEMPHQGRAPERAGGRLAQHRLAVDGRKFVDDVETPLASVDFGRVFDTVLHISLLSVPRFDAGVAQPGYMHHRYPRFPHRFQQRLDVRDSVPRRQPATARPVLYGLQQRLRLVTVNPPVKVNQKQRRFLPKSHRLVRRHRQVGPVLRGKVGVPYSFRH